MSTSIEWTDETWTVVTGCDVVDPACGECYALNFAPRLQAMERARRADPDVPEPGEKYQTDSDRPSSGVGFEVVCHPQLLDEPLTWRKPRKVFVTSMGDLFHERVPDTFIAACFATMAVAERHTFQVLTKRIERARDLLGGGMWPILLHDAMLRRGAEPLAPVDEPWPVLPNVWIGTTIATRKFVHRAQVLRETPAAVRFISAEPLLGPLVYDGVRGTPRDIAHGHPSVGRCWYDGRDGPELDLTGIDWLITGGESGGHLKRKPYRFLVERIDGELQPKPQALQWVRDLLAATRCDRCTGNGEIDVAVGRDVFGNWDNHPELCPDCDGTGRRVAFFLKQWGGRTPKAGGRELDGREWSEFPEPVAVRA